MEQYGHFDFAGRHTKNPEIYWLDADVHAELLRVVNDIDDKLEKLVPDSDERDARRARSTAALRVRENIEYHVDVGMGVGPIRDALAVLQAAQKDVIEKRQAALQRVGVDLRTTDSDGEEPNKPDSSGKMLEYEQGLLDSPHGNRAILGRRVIDARDTVVSAFKKLAGTTITADVDIMEWIKRLASSMSEESLEATGTEFIRMFLQQNVIQLVQFIETIDKPINAMPILNPDWEVVKTLNNKLRDLLA